MITCIINGHKAYPISTSSIKVTYANQYVTDDGEYTYDITFPMNILSNREIFKNVSRFEVKKKLAKYDDCKLYCNGLLIMSGVGTVLSVNQKEVKLQLLGGKSRVKYNSKFDKKFIDEMDLGRALHGSMGDQLETVNAKEIMGLMAEVKTFNFYATYNPSYMIGIPGMYVYTPIRDETNDMTANMTLGKNRKRYITNLAVHPNFIHILHNILNICGYKVVRDDFNQNPWDGLYIASAYKSDEFRHALPHWTVYTFLEEFRKLFNARIYFNEAERTVSILRSSELLNAETVEMVALDEFSVDYDEDGSLNTIDTSNVEFNLGESEERDNYEVIPQKVLAYFDIYTYQGMTPELDSIINGWDMKKKRTTIVKRVFSSGSLQAYYIWKADEEDDSKGSWVECGEFSPLIRNTDSDDSITLNIAPAAIAVIDQNFTTYSNWLQLSGHNKDVRPRYMLSVVNTKEAESLEATKDDDGFTYVTVEDAIEDDSNMDNEENDKESMQIYFLLDKMQDATYPLPKGILSTLPQSCLYDNAMDHFMAWPVPVTDDVHLKKVFGITKGWSLSLVQRTAYSLNEFHVKSVIDNKDCMEIKFKSSTIPDPSKIYIFHGKRFVCAKIEVEIKDDGIEPIMTGSFYMIS